MSDLSDETRALLARGREGVPLSSVRRRAIRKAVLATSAAATVVATTTTKTAAAATGNVAGWASATMKVLSVMAVGAAIGGGAVAIVMREEQRATPATSTTALASNATPSSRSSPSSTATETPTSNETPTTASSTTPNTTETALVTAIAETDAKPVHSAVVASPSERIVASSQRADPGETLPTTNATKIAAWNERAGVPPRGRPPSGAATAVAHAGEAPAESATSTRSPASSLAEEARLLNEAHRALATGDGGRALRLLDTHATRFPASALEPERSAERVFALCHENQVDAARVAADAFLSLHPAGPLATRVRASCMSRARE